MGLLQKIRDRWANRNTVSEDEAQPPSRDPRDVNRDQEGIGGAYAPIGSPGPVPDEEE